MPTRPKSCSATLPSVSNETGPGSPARSWKASMRSLPSRTQTAEAATTLARLYQHHRERDGHGAASLPEREAMALGLDGDALDRGGHAGSG